MQLDLDRNAPVVRLPQCHRVIQPVVKIESVADIVGHHIWAAWKRRHRAAVIPSYFGEAC